MNQFVQLLVILLFSFSFAQAQEKTTKSGIDLDEVQAEIKKDTQVTPKTDEEVSGQKIEKVEVTGSHIKRIDIG